MDTPLRVLVVNAGSSSLKLRVLRDGRVLTTVDLPTSASSFDRDQFEEFIADVPVDAVGHRVVHGGTRFTAPTQLTPHVVNVLRELADLAPLHQMNSLAGIDAVRMVLPDIPAVACFDTAFHRTLPPAASTYAVPLQWRQRWGVRRYGFHGLSHSYASRRAAELVDRPAAELRIVVCHLGAGASLCAVRAGRSVDTTMGFTPLDGLVMGSRSGSVDPGLVLWVQEHGQLSGQAVAEALEHDSGLLALGGTADMRQLLKWASAGNDRATLAVDVYVHRLATGIAAMAAAAGGLDVLVFTGGVGENAPAIRAMTAERLAFLGVAVDSVRNEVARTDTDLTPTDAEVRTLVVSAREDLQIEVGVTTVLAAS
jgi:acetate kinase